MTPNDTAWQIIDYWIETDYSGDKATMIDEVGNLDDYAARIADTIERYDLDTSDVIFCASMVELRMREGDRMSIYIECPSCGASMWQSVWSQIYAEMALCEITESTIVTVNVPCDNCGMLHSDVEVAMQLALTKIEFEVTI